MGSVTYTIRQNGRVKTVTGTRLNPHLATRYIQDKGWLVDHMPSQMLASNVYFADLETCEKFGEVFVTALGKYVTKNAMIYPVPGELKLFRDFLDLLRSYYEDKNSPITLTDLKKVISEMERRLKA